MTTHHVTGTGGGRCTTRARTPREARRSTDSFIHRCDRRAGSIRTSPQARWIRQPFHQRTVRSETLATSASSRGRSRALSRQPVTAAPAKAQTGGLGSQSALPSRTVQRLAIFLSEETWLIRTGCDIAPRPILRLCFGNPFKTRSLYRSAIFINKQICHYPPIAKRLRSPSHCAIQH